MGRIAYVNGQYLPHAQASVHVEDRGYQFADGIYEYFAFYNQKIVDLDRHLIRMRRSLEELEIHFPMSNSAIRFIMEELLVRNGRTHGGLYLQITRGVSKRDHPFPPPLKPSLVLTVCGPKIPKPLEVSNGVHVITQPDIRWGRCNIKSVGLLPNVLAKQQAACAKAREAWLVKPDGTITEGAVSNAFIITGKDGIITHPADNAILAGITRDVVLELARSSGLKVSERAFNMSEIVSATEAFITSTSANVLPVSKVDNTIIGNGKPGAITQKLLSLYQQYINDQTGYIF